MNPPLTPDLDGLRKAVQEFQPNPRRVPFNDLKIVHDAIVELRKRSMSYSAIAELLGRHGVKTSRARVAEYGRIVLDGGKSRKRRKRILPAINASPIPQSPSIVPMKSSPATVAPATGNTLSQPKENAAYVSRGPRIAKVELMSPEEAKEFDDSLKAENSPKP